MTLRLTVLGSGSGGNAAVVSLGGTHLLLDCGFSARETARRPGRGTLHDLGRCRRRALGATVREPGEMSEERLRGL
jgi:hypothetical protein